MSVASTLRRILGRPPTRECVHVGRLLQAYLDDEADAPAAARVAAHLELCRVCGLEAETYRALKHALARQHRPDPAALTRLRQFADDLARGEARPGPRPVDD